MALIFLAKAAGTTTYFRYLLMACFDFLRRRCLMVGVLLRTFPVEVILNRLATILRVLFFIFILFFWFELGD